MDTHAEGGEGGGEVTRGSRADAGASAGAGAGLMSDDQRAGLKKVGSLLPPVSAIVKRRPRKYQCTVLLADYCPLECLSMNISCL